MSSRNKIKAVILGIVLVGCFLLAERLRSPSTPDPNLPNLVISQLFYQLQTGDACLDPNRKNAIPMGVGMWIANVGKGDAGNFNVNANGVDQNVTQGLLAGKNIRLWFPVESVVDVRLDTTNLVMESNEQDNTRQERLPIPTQPAFCPTTATPTATKTNIYAVLTKVATRLENPIPRSYTDCKASDASVHCDLAAGHETTISFTTIATPIASTDTRYHEFHNMPMLLWEEDVPIGPSGHERKIIWQMDDYEIHITSFDDTSFRIALDPLHVAEVIYQTINEP